jgi:hypothetical protein
MLLPLYFKEVNMVTLKKEETLHCATVLLTSNINLVMKANLYETLCFHHHCSPSRSSSHLIAVVTVLAVDRDRQGP